MLNTTGTNEIEMAVRLASLLYKDETLEAGVFCIYKQTGFFARNDRIITGYVGVTSINRLIGYKTSYLDEGPVSLDIDSLTKIKISDAILGQKVIYLKADDGGKKEVKFQVSPKVNASEFPNQGRNLEIIIKKLKSKQSVIDAAT